MTIRTLFVRGLIASIGLAQLTACKTMSKIDTVPTDLVALFSNNTCWVGGAAAASSINYVDNCNFDRDLRASLSAKSPLVTVQADGNFKVDVMPARLSNWIKRVKSTEGAVLTCAEADGTMGIISLLPIILEVIGGVRTYVVYDPAKSYNAAIIASKEGVVRKVQFALRGGAAPACPAGTTQVVDQK